MLECRSKLDSVGRETRDRRSDVGRRRRRPPGHEKFRLNCSKNLGTTTTSMFDTTPVSKLFRRFFVVAAAVARLGLFPTFIREKIGQSRPRFVYFCPFLITISIIQIEKSLAGVLGTQTCGCRMAGADKTTKLWRPSLFPTICGGEILGTI